jgi:hypothetical protein
VHRAFIHGSPQGWQTSTGRRWSWRHLRWESSSDGLVIVPHARFASGARAWSASAEVNAHVWEMVVNVSGAPERSDGTVRLPARTLADLIDVLEVAGCGGDEADHHRLGRDSWLIRALGLDVDERGRPALSRPEGVRLRQWLQDWLVYLGRLEEAAFSGERSGLAA